MWTKAFIPKAFFYAPRTHGLSGKSTFLDQKKKKKKNPSISSAFTPLRFLHNTCTIYFKGLHPLFHSLDQPTSTHVQNISMLYTSSYFHFLRHEQKLLCAEWPSRFISDMTRLQKYSYSSTTAPLWIWLAVAKIFTAMLFVKVRYWTVASSDPSVRKQTAGNWEMAGMSGPESIEQWDGCNHRWRHPPRGVRQERTGMASQTSEEHLKVES